MGLFDVGTVIKGIKFNSVSFDDIETFEEYLNANNHERVPFFSGIYSYYLPSMLAGDKFLWKIIDGSLCFFQKHRNYIELSSTPLSKKPLSEDGMFKLLEKVYKVLKVVNDNKHTSDMMYLIKNDVVKLTDKRFKKYVKNYTVYDDFIFRCSDLINLSGKKYSSRRNIVNNFKKTYPNHNFRFYTEADIPAIRRVRDVWKKERSSVLKSFWDDKIFEVRIKNVDALKYRIVVAEVDEKIQGFLMVSPHCKNTLCVVMENTNVELKGLTECLWYESLRLNQDMGEFENDGGGYTPKHGLYHYKASHRPIMMLELSSVGVDRNVFPKLKG